MKQEKNLRAVKHLHSLSKLETVKTDMFRDSNSHNSPGHTETHIQFKQIHRGVREAFP